MITNYKNLPSYKVNYNLKNSIKQEIGNFKVSTIYKSKILDKSILEVSNSLQNNFLIKKFPNIIIINFKSNKLFGGYSPETNNLFLNKTKLLKYEKISKYHLLLNRIIFHEFGHFIWFKLLKKKNISIYKKYIFNNLKKFNINDLEILLKTKSIKQINSENKSELLVILSLQFSIPNKKYIDKRSKLNLKNIITLYKNIIKILYSKHLLILYQDICQKLITKN